MPITSAEIRQKFLEFFEARGHAIVHSSSLIPDDPSVLLTTAGMQQFKKYYTGEADPMKDFGSKSTASCQKSFRTSDIDEVGDESHLTFFEMLGNFSFGGYFKKEAIQYAHEFITKEMGLEISYVTIFKGKKDIGVPKDAESHDIWKSLDPKLEVREEGMGDVFWGPTGSSGPCGPTTEIYCKNGAGQDIEVWNIVFNQYLYPGSREELNSGAPGKKLEPLKTPGVDTGMGLERLAMCVQKVNTIFETGLFSPLMELLPDDLNVRAKRIISDHIRGIAFLIGDGLVPSAKKAESVLRKLIRRVLFCKFQYNLITNPFPILLRTIKAKYSSIYPEIQNIDRIVDVFEVEQMNFEGTVPRAIREMERRLGLDMDKNLNDADTRFLTEKQIENDIFDLHQSFGMSIEMLEELLLKYGFRIDKNKFLEIIEKRNREHYKISKVGSEKKFGGHGLILNTGEVKAGNEEEFKKALKLHTTTHLLQRALREVLGNEVHQMGSDVTAERTRFDFSFPRKVTKEEIGKVEILINEKIKEDLPVNFVELPKAEAEKSGALYFFKEKYPEKVKVYYIGKDLESAWSKEFCGGPHVNHTGEIGKVRIAKEEAVSSGVRRIRAILI